MALISRPLSPNLRGAAWMFVSALCFTVMAATLKLLAERGFSESQMVFARCAAGFAMLLPFALRAGASAWAVKRPWPVFLRCVYSTLGFFAGFYAFAHLPLAQAQALSFSRVLFITIFAVWILGERVAWRRWTAVGIGFAGVVIMVRPDAGAVDFATGMAVLSSLLFALAIVTVKDLTRDHSTMTLVLITNAFTTIAGLPFAFFGWAEPNLEEWIILAVLGVSGVGAQSAYVRALSHGEASLVGLVDYVRLPLAALLGWALFSEAPSLYTLLGAAVIIAATLYITLREAKLKGPEALSPASAETPPR